MNAKADRDGGTTLPGTRLPDAEPRPWRPSRRQGIVAAAVVVVCLVALSGARLYYRWVSDCDAPLWVYCIVCPRLGGMPATVEKSQVGPYTRVALKSGFTGEAVYFDAAGRLVAAELSSDFNEYCSRTEMARWFGQRFWAHEPARPYDAMNPRPTFEKLPTPQGADHWR